MAAARDGTGSVIDWTAKRQACLNCGRDGERGWRGTLGVFTTTDGRLCARCHRCGTTLWPDDDREPVIVRLGHGKPQADRLSEYGLELWAECRLIDGTAAAYLRARRVVIPPEGSHLRWHPALRHPLTGTLCPALVALVTDAATGVPITLHRTWIAADGTKPLKPARMLLGGHRKAGGVVRLWADADVTLGLGLAEGVETALSMAHAFAPVWAAIDAGNLAAFPVLGGIEALTIAVDHDAAGINAANQCAARWTAAGREVRIVMAPQTGADLNDVAVAA